jgi:hypothetical protein
VTDPTSAPTAARLEALRRESNLVLAEASQAQQMAAENLLEKAAVALRQGDRDKARAMVRRTQALGHDDHEDVDVCSWSVHMTLFTLVTDVLDDSDDEWTWLDAATTVLPTVPETGRMELIDVLGTIRQDSRLDHAASTRLEPLVREAVRRPAITEGRVLDVEEVLDVLVTIAAYEDAVDALEGEPS